jgi:hypothetical protein
MGRLSSSFQAKHPKKFFFPAWTPFVFCYSWSIFFLGPKRFIRTSEILDPKTRLPMFGKSPW